jgi:sugar phosphate permease
MMAHSIHDVDLDKEKVDNISRVESGTNNVSHSVNCAFAIHLQIALADNLKVTPTISYTAAEEKAVKRKQDYVILPLCASIYFLCYLDRSNIGNARILNSSTHNDMQTETHTTVTQFNIALMIFLVAYAIFEVPSNILLKKLKPSRWLAFLMFTWGAITIGLGGVSTFSEMTAVRFLLGMSEAGLFPGLVCSAASIVLRMRTSLM